MNNMSLFTCQVRAKKKKKKNRKVNTTSDSVQQYGSDSNM